MCGGSFLLCTLRFQEDKEGQFRSSLSRSANNESPVMEDAAGEGASVLFCPFMNVL